MYLVDRTCRIIAYPPVDFPAGAGRHEIAQRCWDFFVPILRAPARALAGQAFSPPSALRRPPCPLFTNDSPDFEKLLRKSRTSRLLLTLECS
jgi:hypothetical protein